MATPPSPLSFVYILQLNQDDAVQKIHELTGEGGRGIRYLVTDPNEARRLGLRLTDIAASGTNTLMYVNVGNVEPKRPVIYPKGSWGDPAQYASIQDPGWPDEYTARYWEEGWQDMILAKVRDIAAMPGVSGIYLDNVLVWYRLEEARQAGQLPKNVTYPSDFADAMAHFVKRIAQTARAAGNPQFQYVIIQNSEALATENHAPWLLDHIDGVGVEDVEYADYYYWPGVNAVIERQYRHDILTGTFVANGKLVLAVEYADSKAFTLNTAQQCAVLGNHRLHGYDGVYIAADRGLTGTILPINTSPASVCRNRR